MLKRKNKLKIFSSGLLLGLITIIPTILVSCVQLNDNGRDPYISIKSLENNTKVIRLHPRDERILGESPKYPIDLTPHRKLLLIKKELYQEFKAKYQDLLKGNFAIDEDVAYKQWINYLHKNHKNQMFLLINDISKFDVNDFLEKNSLYEGIDKIKRDLINEIKKVDFSKKSLLVFSAARYSHSTILMAYNSGFWIKDLSIDNQQKKINISFEWVSKKLPFNVGREVGQSITMDEYLYFVEIDKISNLDNYEINYQTNS